MERLFKNITIPSDDIARHQYSVQDGGSGTSLVASTLIEGFKQSGEIPCLVVAESDREAQVIFDELGFFLEDIGDKLAYLPDSETLPYDTESPHSGLVSERAKIFHAIFSDESPSILITSVGNLVSRISGAEHWKNDVIYLKANQVLDGGIEFLVEAAIDLGYQEKEIEIEDLGEFSYRNNVFDIYPLGASTPIRIKFDSQNRITIFELGLSNQLSKEPISEITILPAKEIPTSKQAQKTFRRRFREVFRRGLGVSVYEDVGNGVFPSGVEAYLPLFQDNTTNLLELFLSRNGAKSKLFLLGRVEEKLQKTLNGISQRYKDLSELESRPILPPEQVWMTQKECKELMQNYQIIDILNNEANAEQLKVKPTNIKRRESLQATLDLIEEAIDFAEKIVFCLHSDIREQQVRDIFDMLDVEAENVGSWKEAVESESRLSIVNSKIDKGFFLPIPEVILITEKEVFGQPIFAKNANPEDRLNNFQAVQDLVNLNIGDPVVHLKYGVGRFNGLETTEINGVSKEFMTIMYAEKAKVFVHMDQLDLVSRYSGTDRDKAPLDTGSIGSKWSKSTKAAKKNVIALAKDLIEIQANRQVKEGKKYKKPDYRYIKFEQEFPFQETEDQKNATQDILNDLQTVIMDRVVCGDVGFGKTEIAMKSSAYNVFNGYQVVILAPTTLLAQQHLENFKQRFSSFPDVVIEGLFGGDKAHERSVLRRAKEGKIDIIIGTHRVLQSDVEFSDLGLVIIDEEHRFGVKQKEHFRTMRKDINLLSMTATPIPRTLSMSMHGIRDISIIATPPAKRLSIRTFLENEEKSVIIEAVNREVRRNGQIFYLHNRTETIAAKTEQLQNLFPELKIRYGHGKMKEAELENLMADFYRGEFDMLVATTIIETGIDCPNANTILIEQAENFGIAQLHQLRGRVGRSHHQAYCYLLRSQDMISETGEKRLKAMTKATKLGEGFVLANHDLEIRGAGEILGEEQSGQIQKVGFAIYLRLLERAIEALKQGIDVEKALDLARETIVDIGMSAYIENTFIENDRARLSFYKRIVSAESQIEVDAITTEIEDKYGPIPNITSRFIRLFRNKVLASKAEIRKMMLNSKGGFIGLAEGIQGEIAENMLDLVLSNTEIFKLKTPTSFELIDDIDSEDDRFQAMERILTKLVPIHA